MSQELMPMLTSTRHGQSRDLSAAYGDGAAVKGQMSQQPSLMRWLVPALVAGLFLLMPFAGSVLAVPAMQGMLTNSTMRAYHGTDTEEQAHCFFDASMATSSLANAGFLIARATKHCAPEKLTKAGCALDVTEVLTVFAHFASYFESGISTCLKTDQMCQARIARLVAALGDLTVAGGLIQFQCIRSHHPHYGTRRLVESNTTAPASGLADQTVPTAAPAAAPATTPTAAPVMATAAAPAEKPAAAAVEAPATAPAETPAAAAAERMAVAPAPAQAVAPAAAPAETPAAAPDTATAPTKSFWTANKIAHCTIQASKAVLELEGAVMYITRAAKYCPKAQDFDEGEGQVRCSVAVNSALTSLAESANTFATVALGCAETVQQSFHLKCKLDISKLVMALVEIASSLTGICLDCVWKANARDNGGSLELPRRAGPTRR